MPRMRQRRGGFSLIELMVAVVVMAILAAIAIPQYNRYSLRARRADGQKLLLAIGNAEERYYAQQNKYADLKTIGFSATTTATSDSGYYAATVDVTAVNTFAAQAFKATAAPVAGGPQAKDACLSLTYTNTGVKDQTGNATTNGSCW
ncbi:prepilin-type N-terminal cleavage/methylation domain-containing protein [Luteibacter pinisoli]|uniref:Prepilin-type N-terminal cleavage/methylation domain-containing protein n=2 Tax=Luteibacter pinisoli TaxID=2589080 RepID=A0A4Y5Z8L4_9GAMM|nr:prepilin-type N-terminal cleavage/methylation domain-containing protein [Luteibacter pinisoli]